jgi:hypothetical protein
MVEFSPGFSPRIVQSPGDWGSTPTCVGIVFAAAVIASFFGGCAPPSAEWIDSHTLDPEARADYEVFALRCSKCHSLARPLNSGIDSDEYWQKYVARMRRQPGSGITPRDSVAILRFLHVYSVEERRKKAEAAGGTSPSLSAPPAAPAAPDADAAVR